MSDHLTKRFRGDNHKYRWIDIEEFLKFIDYQIKLVCFRKLHQHPEQ